jgi:hypothetical protein
VDANGKPTRARHTVRKLVEGAAAGRKEVLAAGALISATLVGMNAIFEVNGMPAEPEVAKVLRRVVSLSKNLVTDDQIFGTNDRKKIGETWAMNSTLAKQDLEKRFGFPIDKMAGETTLVAATKVDGAEVLIVKSHISAEGIQFPLPRGFMLDSSTLDGDLSGTFPVRRPDGKHEQSAVIKFLMNAHHDPPSGARVIMRMQLDETGTESSTYLP